jgi:catechol 2,3-dioxygenase-like lactoylglutathione lyase family enzyme
VKRLTVSPIGTIIEETMKHESAVDFATNTRIHIAIAVNNLQQSVEFYRTLFGQAPTKTRPQYAKFEVAEPPVNLALNESNVPSAPSNAIAHFGIQVKSTCAVDEMIGRLRSANQPAAVEDHVTCCYAVQNKVWTNDPDGNKWEIYVLLDNDAAQHGSSANGCCTVLQMAEASSSCCTPATAAATNCCTVG